MSPEQKNLPADVNQISNALRIALYLIEDLILQSRYMKHDGKWLERVCSEALVAIKKELA